MKDLERLLSEAMRAEGEQIDPDIHSARRRFLEKRRKRRFTLAYSGVALAGAAIAAAVFVASSVPSPFQEDELDLAFAIPAVVATASVPGEPQAAAVVADGVWVSNATLGVVSKVDPESNEVMATLDVGAMRLEGEPDELVAAGDSLLVTTTSGEVLVLDGATGGFAGGGRPVSVSGAVEPGAAARPSDLFRLDLDVSEEGVWIADENNGALHSFFAAGSGGSDFTSTPVDDLAPDDVAVGDGRVFALDSERGLVAVYEISGESGAPQTIVRAGEPFTVPSGNFMDMRYGFGKLWISDDSGSVHAFDPGTGELLSTTDVGGRYADLTVDADSVWALPAGEGDGGRLVALDPEDGQLRNEGMSLGGNPVDVVSGLGSLWVVDRAGDQGAAGPALLRVDPTGEGTPSPEPDDTQPDDNETSAQPFFVYSADGDIYMEMTDGTTKQVTMTADDEFNPTFGFDTLIFERHDYENDWSGLIEHNLTTGEEQMLQIDGASHPAMSAGSDLAWVNDSGSIEIWPQFPTKKGEAKRFEVPLPGGLSDPRSLIFSDDAKFLYYQAIGEGWVTVQLSIEGDGAPSSFVLNGINDQPSGATYIQPEDPYKSVTVLEVCCREVEGDPYSQFSVSRIALTEGGASHEFVTGPVALEGADPASLTMTSLHGASLGSDGAWSLFDDPKGSWLVTDGTSLWLLSTGGGEQLAPDTLAGEAEISGFSVNPTLEGY